MSEPENTKWVPVRHRRVPGEAPPPKRVTEQMRRDHEAMEWLEREEMSVVCTHQDDWHWWEVDCPRGETWGKGKTPTDAILAAKAKWEADHG